MVKTKKYLYFFAMIAFLGTLISFTIIWMDKWNLGSFLKQLKIIKLC
ncbi:hypothetical protein [Spiroplasma citri]|nr:hypothetical protein [Spiroplasma citri]WFG97815.1 hypothetical protein M1770_07070 [Spiroplasma citri]